MAAVLPFLSHSLQSFVNADHCPVLCINAALMMTVQKVCLFVMDLSHDSINVTDPANETYE